MCLWNEILLQSFCIFYALKKGMQFLKNFMLCKHFEVSYIFFPGISRVLSLGKGGSDMPTPCSIVVQWWQSGWKNAYCIHSLVFSLRGQAGRNQSRHVTGMALAHCILGKFLGVVCHCFPPPLDIPTFAARCLYVRNDMKDPSSERWNCGRESVW